MDSKTREFDLFIKKRDLYVNYIKNWGFVKLFIKMKDFKVNCCQGYFIAESINYVRYFDKTINYLDFRYYFENQESIQAN